MNASRDIKIGDSIRHTTNGIINHFGIQNCYFITIGLSGDSSLRPISKKLKKFLMDLTLFLVSLTISIKTHQ
jgi:hypothetical protein